MRKIIEEIVTRYDNWRRMRQFKREFEELFMPDEVANREIAFIMAVIITTVLICVFLH